MQLLLRKDGIEPTAVGAGSSPYQQLKNDCVHGIFHPITTRYNSSNMMGRGTTKIPKRPFTSDFTKQKTARYSANKTICCLFPDPPAHPQPGTYEWSVKDSVGEHVCDVHGTSCSPFQVEPWHDTLRRQPRPSTPNATLRTSKRISRDSNCRA